MWKNCGKTQERNMQEIGIPLKNKPLNYRNRWGRSLDLQQNYRRRTSQTNIESHTQIGARST